MLQVAEREKAVLVGDRMHDVEGAQRNAIDCIGVTLGFGSLEELRRAGGTYIVQTMDELRSILLD